MSYVVISEINMERDDEIIGRAASFQGVAARRAKAAVEEGLEAIKTETARLAAPHYRSGDYERGLQVHVLRSSKGAVHGEFAATSAHSEVLEKGRRSVWAMQKKAVAFSPISGAGAEMKRIARAHVGPAPAYHFVEEGRALAEPAIKAAQEFWGHAIAADLRGRVR